MHPSLPKAASDQRQRHCHLDERAPEGQEAADGPLEGEREVLQLLQVGVAISRKFTCTIWGYVTCKFEHIPCVHLLPVAKAQTPEEWLHDHGQGLGAGLRLLSLFRCQDTLAAFQRLPPSQRNTGAIATLD